MHNTQENKKSSIKEADMYANVTVGKRDDGSVTGPDLQGYVSFWEAGSGPATLLQVLRSIYQEKNEDLV
jgi:hypothetical protein